MPHNEICVCDTSAVEFGTIILSGTAISSIPIISSGSGYVSPTIFITDTNGVGAIASAVLNDYGGIKSITISNGGSGYTSSTIIEVQDKLRGDYHYNTLYPTGIIASVDVGEFIMGCHNKDGDANYICIHNKQILTVSQFKQMFFADGSHFSPTEPPQCIDASFGFIESLWCLPSKNTHIANTGFPLAVTELYYAEYPIISLIANQTEVIWKPTRADKHRDWAWVTKSGTGTTPDEHGWVPKTFLTPISGVKWINYNKLGGRGNDPDNFLMAYVHESCNPIKEQFYAQKTIIENIEHDLCISENDWSLCSRSIIFDQLYNLSFMPQNFSESCLTIHCARSWKEIDEILKKDNIKWTLNSGENIINFNYLYPHSSDRNSVENVFKQLSNDLGANYSVREAGTAFPKANYIAGQVKTWAYYDCSGDRTVAWELQVGMDYIIDIPSTSIATLPTGTILTFHSKKILVGEYIQFNINITINNDNEDVLPNIIQIRYICRVDKELDSYCLIE